MNQAEKLVVIIGPTSVGKTGVGIELAKRHQGEVISGDSMQIYRGLDIGTAKATEAEMDGVVHHLIDILDVREDFSAAMFKELSAPIISRLNQNGQLPIVVGGTGLYIQSLIDNYNFVPTAGSDAFRAEMQQVMDREGSAGLYRQLCDIDPDSAAKIHPNDQKRIIRALEVFHLTAGSKLSESGKGISPYNLLYIGLTMDRKTLYENINKRVDIMIDKGLVEEARYLYELNLPADTRAMQSIGYKELFPYFQGEMSLDACVEILKQSTRRFAKRQLTWFRRDPRILWFEIDQMDRQQLLQKIDLAIAGKFY